MAVLGKSGAYPYGLTPNMIERLQGAGLATVREIANTTDEKLDDIERIGGATWNFHKSGRAITLNQRATRLWQF